MSSDLVQPSSVLPSSTLPSSTLPSSVAIAMGSNLGDSFQILESALLRLNQTDGIQVIARSPWYRTEPIGPPQPDYLNGCALLVTTLAPEDLLDQLLAIEADFGRLRQERWGARTLDLDILLYADQIRHTPRLQIPHPHLCDRAFVLVPLADIAPDWIEPISQVAIAEILKQVDCAGVRSYAPDDKP